jgi:hypothetical protein
MKAHIVYDSTYRRLVGGPVNGWRPAQAAVQTLPALPGRLNGDKATLMSALKGSTAATGSKAPSHPRLGQC